MIITDHNVVHLHLPTTAHARAQSYRYNNAHYYNMPRYAAPVYIMASHRAYLTSAIEAHKRHFFCSTEQNLLPTSTLITTITIYIRGSLVFPEGFANSHLAHNLLTWASITLLFFDVAIFFFLIISILWCQHSKMYPARANSRNFVRRLHAESILFHINTSIMRRTPFVAEFIKDDDNISDALLSVPIHLGFDLPHANFAVASIYTY